jgi:hypothetical protein
MTTRPWPDRPQTPLQQAISAWVLWSYALPWIALIPFAQNPPGFVMLLSNPR